MRIIPKFNFDIVTYSKEISVIEDLMYNSKNSKKETNEILYEKYPELNNLKFNMNDILNEKQVHIQLESNLKKDFFNNMLSIMKVLKRYEAEWEKIRQEVLIQLSIDMDIEWEQDIISVIVGSVPMCPRWLDTYTFYVPTYLENFNEIALHECCHFIFVHKCKNIFNGINESYFEYPRIHWILSEVLIDVILNNFRYTRFVKKEIKAYDYFYDLQGKNIVEEINKIYYIGNSMKEKIVNCMEYIIKNNIKSLI
ncbi:MAG: hypothetical protein Q4G05_06275 [Clostridia bacterium]|nr:hypothetical protein [Clostridia bacterium]